MIDVEIGQAPARLVLRRVESANESRHLQVELLLDTLNARLVVHDLAGADRRGDFDALATAFQEVASDFGARDEHEIWSSADSDLVLSVSSDALGHISLIVELSQMVEDGWSARGTIPLEFGALSRIASQLIALVAGSGASTARSRE